MRLNPLFELLQFPFYPGRLTSKIQNRTHISRFVPYLVVDRIGKLFLKQAMEPAKVDGVNSRVELEGVDIRVKRIKEILA